VLRERLFLNPLNDLGELLIAAHDPLSPVSIVMPLGKGPYLFSYFNSLKQEFVSARFLLYQGLRRHGRHFSDRGVKLSDTLDDSVRGLGMEKVKAAFRVAYSLLDKVAFFLNDYFTLRIRHQDVSFRDLWYEPKKKGAAKDATRVLRSQFVDAENLPLRGLFWISKDLMARHAPVMTTVKPGVIRISGANGEKESFVVFGGFADILPEGCTLLAESAVRVAESDRADLEKRVQDAREDIQDARDESSRSRAEEYLQQLITLQAAVSAG
jgi:ATP synthase F1 epsilon subunit